MQSSNRYNHLTHKPHSQGRVLIHGIRFALTVNELGKLDVMTNKSLLIEDGIIVGLFDKADVHRQFDINTADLIYDAEQKGGIVLTPGFINMHAHPPMYLLRSTLTLAESDLLDALKGMAVIEGKMTSDDFYLGALGDFTEEQKSGITTTVSHYGVFDPIERATRETGQHVINCVSAASNSHPENTPELVESYLKRKDTTSIPGAALHYVWKADKKVLKKIALLKRKYNMHFTLHVAESKRTVDECIARLGAPPIDILEQFGLLDNKTILSHAVHLNEHDISRIKKYGATAVHLPTSNLLHRSGQFDYPLFKKLDAQTQITLGTDSVVSKNRLDLLSEALAAKTLHQASSIMPYEELFNTMTAQAGRLLGYENLGRIAPGFRANLAFWKLKDRGFLPYDQDHPETLVSNMITHGGRMVRDLMIDGTFVISDRTHNLVDESELLDQLQEAHMGLRSR